MEVKIRLPHKSCKNDLLFVRLRMSSVPSPPESYTCVSKRAAFPYQFRVREVRLGGWLAFCTVIEFGTMHGKIRLSSAWIAFTICSKNHAVVYVLTDNGGRSRFQILSGLESERNLSTGRTLACFRTRDGFQIN